MAATWTYVLAVGAMVLVGVRPKKVPDWVWPLSGAALLVMFGIEPLQALGVSVVPAILLVTALWLWILR